MRSALAQGLVLAFGLSLSAAGCATGGAPPPAAPPAAATQAQAAPIAQAAPPPPPASPYPPAVLTGDGQLHCTIDSRSNGHQKLEIASGGGLEFDAVVSPIVDGRVTNDGPDKGGQYRFTSHLAKQAKGRLPGTGEVDIEELETKVTVEMNRYKQPGGPGTKLTFSSADMSRRGIYVEFAGKARAPSGERFAFRVNLGAPVEGSGEVIPRNDNREAEMMSKAVYIRAPVSTVVVTTTLERAP